jgi:cytochrome c-type biogenesis protein CcmE
MNRRRAKFLFLGLGVVAVMAVLLAVGVSGPGGLAFYVTVSEFVDGGPWEAETIRVNGRVEGGSIERSSNGAEVRFVMTEGGASLPVHYAGMTPDSFVDGADVVVEGNLESEGTFEAHLLLAKCPSKYEAALEEGEENPHTEPTRD